MTRTKKILIAFAALVLVIAGLIVHTAIASQDMINQRLEKGWILPPLEIYSRGIPLTLGRKFNRAALEEEFRRRNLQAQRDYELTDRDTCAKATSLTLKESSAHCLLIKEEQVMVAWDNDGWIQEIWHGSPAQPVASFNLYPRLITQFYDGQPILQHNTPLSDIPLYCLQAVTAIEDRDFLEHRGVSATGTLRAVYRNLRAGRWAEGGSTITQQLVKNFFLTPKKTIRRKLQEQMLAVMLESQIGKDQIFEMYLNVIYMGQNGPYQVRGFGSASDYYFDKPISRLDLPECALMGAMINSPGRYSPFDKPERARDRRNLVLKKMREENMISEAEMARAESASLPARANENRRASAPYFVMSAIKEFQSWDVGGENGARIYTTLDPDAQVLMVNGINKVIAAVEKRVKKPSKQPLQVAAITVDLNSADVLALTGGRDFRTTQYNRAVDSRRQIGSIVKPFVYWTALKDHDPMTVVRDEPFEWKVHKQVWKPKNYEKGNEGDVPYFYALTRSLNVPAAKVGQEVGLDNIADVIEKSGISAEVPRLPSLTLGAFELSAWEVAQGYTTLARFGAGDHIHTVIKVEDGHGEVLFERKPSRDLQLPAVPSAVLVGMMKNVFEIGTARAARAWGLAGPYAGKTGTTSDTKDAWFAGFNGRILTVVWVGYDDNTPMGLTGASAALPVWTEITKAQQSIFQSTDFVWPPGVEVRRFTREEVLKMFPQLKDIPDQIDLVFADWAS
jgi:penicillin-binding protein 1B